MEKLYNNIVLGDDFMSQPSDAENVPYLFSPPPVIDISVGRQLFVDDFLIEKTDLSPRYHKANKFEGNPVLYPEMPWEKEYSPCACPKSGGVWYDEEEKIFKMWYEAGWLKNMCYATSNDGINFRKLTFSGNVYDRTTMFYNPFRKKWVISIRDTEFDPFLRVRSYFECDKYPDGIA